MTTTLPAGAPLGDAPQRCALVVEDDADVRRLLVTHLERMAWVVTAAGSGEDGVAAAFRDPPDLVLLDVVLPAMDGRDVLRVLRGQSATSRCRVVITTVLDAGDLDELAVDAVLPKPFTRRELVRVLDDLGLGAAHQGPATPWPPHGPPTTPTPPTTQPTPTTPIRRRPPEGTR